VNSKSLLSPEASIRRDKILLVAGRTFLSCRVFEDALLFLLASVEEHENPSEGEAFARAWDFHSSKTTGQVAGSLRKLVDLPANFEQLVAEGIQARNKFIHGFLRDIVWEVLSEDGSDAMLAQLRDIHTTVQSRMRAVLGVGHAVMVAQRGI